jgi:threonine synthase
MQFYSTNNPDLKADLEEAIFRGLPADNGLFMPERLDPLPPSFFEELPYLSFAEIGFQISRPAAYTGVVSWAKPSLQRFWCSVYVPTNGVL